MSNVDNRNKVFPFYASSEVGTEPNQHKTNLDQRRNSFWSNIVSFTSPYFP